MYITIQIKRSKKLRAKLPRAPWLRPSHLMSSPGFSLCGDEQVLCVIPRGRTDQRDVSRLCMGLPGAEGVAGLLGSRKRWMPLSTALLFWLGEGGGGGVGVVFLLVGASSSASVSSIRGMWGSESSIRNSGWVMKLWMEVRDSGFSVPS